MNWVRLRKIGFLSLIAILNSASIACSSKENSSQIHSVGIGDKLKITQKQFDMLVEQVAALDLQDFGAIGEVIGVKWKRQKGSEIDIPGWTHYDSVDLNANLLIAASYRQQFEPTEKGSNALKITAVELTLKFRDEDHLTTSNLDRKYHAKAYVLPVRGLTLFWIGETEVYMTYSNMFLQSDSDSFPYVSEVAFTWNIDQIKSKYPTIERLPTR